jgi:hypothetical protein
MTCERTPAVHAVISRLKRRDPHTIKGFANSEDIRSCCDKIRELMSDRRNVICDKDWDALHYYTLLPRPFTLAESDRIHALYSQYKYPRLKVSRGKAKRKRRANKETDNGETRAIKRTTHIKSLPRPGQICREGRAVD